MVFDHVTPEAIADLTPALIADLDGIWWIETPTAVVLDREWLRANFGPIADYHGYKRQEPTMQQEWILR